MEKKYEVEHRALINIKTFKKLLNKGKNEYSKSFHGPLIIEDAYFCRKSVKKFKEVEMEEVGSYSLRLRREIEKGKKKIILNTKIISKKGDHNAWLEHEINVSSYEETQTILEDIGFKIFFELKKTRYSFTEGEINICLEDIANFQPAIEIEIITSKGKTILAKKKLLNYFTKNNIEQKSIVKKSITNILMREKSYF
jgi:predicted adenylyl cyclase CyaB